MNEIILSGFLGILNTYHSIEWNDWQVFLPVVEQNFPVLTLFAASQSWHIVHFICTTKVPQHFIWPNGKNWLLGRHNISPIMCLSISWFLGILSFLRFLLTLHIVYPLNFPLVLGSITKQQSCYSVTPALYRSCQKTASWSQIDFPLTRTFSPIPHY